MLTIGVFSSLGINGSYIVSMRTESRDENIKPIFKIKLLKKTSYLFRTYVHHENLLSLAALTFLSAIKNINENENEFYLVST